MDRTNLDENILNDTANVVENGSPSQSLTSEIMKKKDNDIPYKQEVMRKLIHLCSLSIPIAYIFFSKKEALMVLLPLALLMVITDVVTKKIEPLHRIYSKIIGPILRKHEKKNKKLSLNGASWVLISAVVTVLIFPKIIAVTAFTILIISDIAAALVGRKFGKTPLIDKSWEGTGAFIVSAIIVVAVLGTTLGAPASYFIIGAIAGVVGAFAEAASKLLKMDDNFSIPISVGFVMWGLGLLITNYWISFINLL